MAFEHGDPLARAVTALWCDERGALRGRVVSIGPGEVRLMLERGRPTAVLRYGGAVHFERVASVAYSLSDTGGTLVLAADRELEAAEARELEGAVRGSSVAILHLGPAGKVFSFGSEERATAALARWLERAPAVPDEQLGRLEGMLLDEARKQHERIAAVLAYHRALERRSPRATWALVAALIVMFGVQQALGGEVDPVLVRLGALDRARVLDGQVWRLVSCAFLHGGVIHLAFNGYVLWVLGRSLERLLGSARFLVLYAVSAVGGSALSLVMLGDRISVGASGALFGLLAFQAGMAWFRSKLLPDALIPIVRQSMLVTLAMNVGVSFLPRVDWAAHLGGGLVGASLILSGVLTAGLTRPGAHDARNERDERVSVPPAPERWSFVLLGTLATALLAAGPLSAALVERPWELGLPPRFERVRPAGASFSVELPAGTRVRPSREAERGVESVEFGDERSDPAVGSVTRALNGSALVNPGVEENIARALARPPRGMAVASGPATAQVGTRRIVSARYEAGPRLREVAVSLEARGAVRVEVECWSALDEACPAGTALRIAGSYQDGPRP